MPPLRNWPALHAVALAVHAVDPGSDEVSAEHGVHTAEPLELENVPAEQALQDVALPPAGYRTSPHSSTGQASTTSPAR
jgi:hypothetical protein